MNSSDQGNKQDMYSGNQGSSQSGSQGFSMSESEQEMDIGIEGFSYGEVRRLERSRSVEGNRQSSSEQTDATPQGGSEQSSS
ncbi:MAG TPA: hypothetical protein VGP06_15110 [Janthinobacterium sp.]|jgi:hypothetical protein|nr:hypothetical protein [Janthinobacterium sp.]